MATLCNEDVVAGILSWCGSHTNDHIYDHLEAFIPPGLKVTRLESMPARVIIEGPGVHVEGTYDHVHQRFTFAPELTLKWELTRIRDLMGQEAFDEWISCPSWYALPHSGSVLMVARDRKQGRQYTFILGEECVPNSKTVTVTLPEPS